MDFELSQLVTPTEAAEIKGWRLNTFQYRIAKPDAPQPVVVGRGHLFYSEPAIRAWNPPTQVRRSIKRRT